jgi:hypothetical protein
LEPTARLPSVKRRSPREAIGALRSAPVLCAAALAGVLALSGCEVFSPIQTAVPYQPADGVSVDLGNVQIRDLVVVSGAKGGAGTLSGLAVNNGAVPITVSFSAATATPANPAIGGDAAQASLPAGAAVRLDGVAGGTPVSLPSVPAAPGDIVTLTVSTPSSGSTDASVPVLPPTGYYSTITPGPAPSTP